MTTTQRPVPIDRPRRYSPRGLLRLDHASHASQTPSRPSRSSSDDIAAQSSHSAVGATDGAGPGPSSTKFIPEGRAGARAEVERQRVSRFGMGRAGGDDEAGRVSRARSSEGGKSGERRREQGYIMSGDLAGSDPSCSSRPSSPLSTTPTVSQRQSAHQYASPSAAQAKHGSGYTLRSRPAPCTPTAAVSPAPASVSTSATSTRQLRSRHSIPSSSSTSIHITNRNPPPTPSTHPNSILPQTEGDMTRAKVRKTTRAALLRLRDDDTGMYSGADSDREYSSSLSGLSDNSYPGDDTSRQGSGSRYASEGRSEATGSDDGATGNGSAHGSQASSLASFASTPTSSSDYSYTSTPLHSSKRGSGKRKVPHTSSTTSTSTSVGTRISTSHPSRPRSRTSRTRKSDKAYSTTTINPLQTRTTRSTRPAAEAFITLEDVNDEKSGIGAEVRRLGLTMFHVEGDGSCFFRACSYSLFGHQGHHRLLRQATCDHVLRTVEGLRVFEAGLEGVGSVEELVHKMRGYSFYAQGPIPMALAEMIGWDLWLVQANHSHKIVSANPNHTAHPRRICSPGFAPLDIPAPVQGKTALWLSFQLMGAHYTSIVMPVPLTAGPASAAAAVSSTATAAAAGTAPIPAAVVITEEARGSAMPRHVEGALVPDSYMQPHADDQSTEARAWRDRQAGSSTAEGVQRDEERLMQATEGGPNQDIDRNGAKEDRESMGNADPSATATRDRTRADVDTSADDRTISSDPQEKQAQQYRERQTSPTTSTESADTSISHSTTSTEPASPSGMSSASISASSSAGSSNRYLRGGHATGTASQLGVEPKGDLETSLKASQQRAINVSPLRHPTQSSPVPTARSSASNIPEEERYSGPTSISGTRRQYPSEAIALEEDGFYIEEDRSSRPFSFRPRLKSEPAKEHALAQRRGSMGGASVISVQSSSGSSADGMEVEEIIA